MGTVERSEHVALVALLRARSGGLSWADITAEVIATGSAVTTWRQHVPDALFEDPSHIVALAAAEKDLDSWTAAGVNFLSILDGDYPMRLRGIHQAPPVLFWRGQLLASDGAVSVVGSRKASSRGVSIASEIARALVNDNITAVAGLAAGIDAAVHQAALDVGGRTVAVIGTGINKYYPAQNKVLQDEIALRGLLVSQFWPDAPPRPQNFLMRNATMSGYGLATVVVEAGETSGTRAQARMAVEHGRAVVLIDSVVEQNKWAQNLVGRPGVHCASSLKDVIEVVRRVIAERRDAACVMKNLIPAQ
jgi:DNA processing protein